MNRAMRSIVCAGIATLLASWGASAAFGQGAGFAQPKPPAAPKPAAPPPPATPKPAKPPKPAAPAPRPFGGATDRPLAPQQGIPFGNHTDRPLAPQAPPLAPTSPPLGTNTGRPLADGERAFAPTGGGPGTGLFGPAKLLPRPRVGLFRGEPDADRDDTDPDDDSTPADTLPLPPVAAPPPIGTPLAPPPADAAPVPPAQLVAETILDDGREQLKRGWFHLAEASFSALVSLWPDSADARLGHGLALAAVGNVTGAASAWKDALRLAPSLATDALDFVSALGGGAGYDVVAAKVDAHRRAYPLDTDGMFVRGFLAVNGGELAVARDAFALLVEHDPTWPQARTLALRAEELAGPAPASEEPEREDS